MKTKVGMLCRVCNELLTESKCSCGNCGVGEKNGSVIMFTKDFFLSDIVQVVVDGNNNPVWYKSLQVVSDTILTLPNKQVKNIYKLLEKGNNEE